MYENGHCTVVIVLLLYITIVQIGEVNFLQLIIQAQATGSVAPQFASFVQPRVQAEVLQSIEVSYGQEWEKQHSNLLFRRECYCKVSSSPVILLAAALSVLG